MSLLFSFSVLLSPVFFYFLSRERFSIHSLNLGGVLLLVPLHLLILPSILLVFLCQDSGDSEAEAVGVLSQGGGEIGEIARNEVWEMGPRGGRRGRCSHGTAFTDGPLDRGGGRIGRRHGELHPSISSMLQPAQLHPSISSRWFISVEEEILGVGFVWKGKCMDFEIVSMGGHFYYV